MIRVRAATDADGHDLAALFGAVFAEYDGAVFVMAEMPELHAIAGAFRKAGGEFWIAERELYGKQVVTGSVGYTGAGDGIELKKLYVAKSERKTGLGGRLLDLVEAAARARAAAFIELWSDPRFVPAHRFYEKRGYLKDGRTRELHDASASVEFYFRKVVNVSDR